MKKTDLLKKNQDGSFVLTVKITPLQLEHQKTKVLQLFISTLELEGFRKGQVPPEIAKTKIDDAKLTSQSIQEILNQTYQSLLQKYALKPIFSPRVKVLSPENKTDTDLIINITSCEKPVLFLKPYQETIKAINLKNKTDTPKQANRDDHIQKILAALLGLSQITISEFLIEEETNHKLSQLINQLQQANMSLDDYFRSQKTSLETFKTEFQKHLKNEWTLTLILEKVADDLKVVIGPKEIDQAIPPKAEKTADRYLLAQILRQKKTIDQLTQI